MTDKPKQVEEQPSLLPKEEAEKIQHRPNELMFQVGQVFEIEGVEFELTHVGGLELRMKRVDMLHE